MVAVVLSPTPITPSSRERTTVTSNSGSCCFKVKAVSKPALPPPRTTTFSIMVYSHVAPSPGPGFEDLPGRDSTPKYTWPGLGQTSSSALPDAALTRPDGQAPVNSLLAT